MLTGHAGLRCDARALQPLADQLKGTINRVKLSTTGFGIGFYPSPVSRLPSPVAPHWCSIGHCRGSNRGRSGARGGLTRDMTSALVAFHVAAHAKRFTTAGMRTAERLFASVAMRVNAQAGRSRKGLVACAADVSVITGRESRNS